MMKVQNSVSSQIKALLDFDANCASLNQIQSSVVHASRPKQSDAIQKSSKPIQTLQTKKSPIRFRPVSPPF
jgi:hypothetical protein